MQPFTSLGLLLNQARHLHMEKHHIIFHINHKKVSGSDLLVRSSSSWGQTSTSTAHSTEGLLLKRGCQRKPPPASSLSGPRWHNSLMASCFSEALRSYAKLMNWESNRYRQKSEGHRPLLKVKWNKLPQQGLARSPSTALHAVYFAQMEMEACLGCDVSLHLWLMHVHTIQTVRNATSESVVNWQQVWRRNTGPFSAMVQPFWSRKTRPMTFQQWIEYFSFRIDTR